MRIRVSDPELVPELLDFLQTRKDVVAEQVSDDEAEVSLIGSYALDAMRMELYLRIRAWEAAQGTRAGSVELVDEPVS
jgi:hypothetical protein